MDMKMEESRPLWTSFLIFSRWDIFLLLLVFHIGLNGAEFSSNEDREFFNNDQLLQKYTRGVVTNVIEMMNLDIEGQLKNKIIPVSE